MRKRSGKTCRDVLRELGIDVEDDRRVIELWNKIDRLNSQERMRLANFVERQPAGAPRGAHVRDQRGGA